MYKIKIYMFILYVVGGKCKFRMVKYQNFFLFDDLTAQYIYIYIYICQMQILEKVKYLNGRNFI